MCYCFFKFDLSSLFYCVYFLCIVFTAGAMGSGKSYTLRWLSKKRLFPLESFIHIDPDICRELLPEYRIYLKLNSSTAGELTQKESNYIVEISTLIALVKGLNVLVEGSLRDDLWYFKYMMRLKDMFPKLRIAVFHVSAPLGTCFKRANRRHLLTRRLVPQKYIQSSFLQIEQSVLRLKQIVDFYCHFHNNINGVAPTIINSSQGDLSLHDFYKIWNNMKCPVD
jgi:hypothetical protein